MTAGRGGLLGLAAVAVAVVVAVAVGFLVQLVGDDLGPRDLPVPPRGEVAAAFVDGHPVFVVAADDGSTHVLDAASPDGGVLAKVLAFCRTSGHFEDLWHGSRFLPDGTWLGGPAPTGMAQYVVTSSAGGHVRVGARQVAPARAGAGRPAAGRDLAPSGPPCDERTALYAPDHPADPAVLDDLVVHTPGPAAADLLYPTPARVLGEEPRDP